MSDSGPVKYREKAHDWEKPQPWLLTLASEAGLLAVRDEGGRVVKALPYGSFQKGVQTALAVCGSGETE